jgi:hypothetical protein
VQLVKRKTPGFLAWLFRPRNPLMRDPEYALLTRAITDAKNKHQPVRGLMEQRQRRLHRLLAARGAA